MARIRDPLFKGCTRPPIVAGVPLGVAVPYGMVSLSLTVYVNVIFVVFGVAGFFVLRSIAKYDDQAFRLLLLRAVLRGSYALKNLRFWKASVYAPVAFTSGKARRPLKLKKSEL
jgi:type IV secretory pathway VirB3-like protein